MESLQAWVAEADGRMTENEATPIGTDIETVERQLANHEVSYHHFLTAQAFRSQWGALRSNSHSHYSVADSGGGLLISNTNCSV